MLSESRLDTIRERWGARDERLDAEYANCAGSYNGVTQRPGFFRFAIFAQRMNRAARIEARFAEHCRRVVRSERRLAA